VGALAGGVSAKRKFGPQGKGCFVCKGKDEGFRGFWFKELPN